MFSLSPLSCNILPAEYTRWDEVLQDDRQREKQGLGFASTLWLSTSSGCSLHVIDCLELTKDTSISLETTPNTWVSPILTPISKLAVTTMMLFKKPKINVCIILTKFHCLYVTYLPHHTLETPSSGQILALSSTDPSSAPWVKEIF